MVHRLSIWSGRVENSPYYLWEMFPNTDLKRSIHYEYTHWIQYLPSNTCFNSKVFLLSHNVKALCWNVPLTFISKLRCNCKVFTLHFFSFALLTLEFLLRRLQGRRVPAQSFFFCVPSRILKQITFAHDLSKTIWVSTERASAEKPTVVTETALWSDLIVIDTFTLFSLSFSVLVYS